MPFTKVGTNEYKSPSGRKFTTKQVKMYYATNGFTKKKKAKISVNNKLKGALGSSEFTKNNKPTGKIQINVKKHKGDKAELASTIKHELMHVAKPNATEKEVYKATAKTKISPTEQASLLAKLRTKGINQKVGVIKRKLKMGKGETKTGDLIAKMNEQKSSNIKNKQTISKTKLSIMGLV